MFNDEMMCALSASQANPHSSRMGAPAIIEEIWWIVRLCQKKVILLRHYLGNV
jgi:hypothetical protein